MAGGIAGGRVPNRSALPAPGLRTETPRWLGPVMQVLVIVVMLAMNLGAGREWRAPLPLSAWLAVVLAVAPPALVWVGTHAACVLWRRAIDRGEGRVVIAADRVTTWFRTGVCVWLGGTAIGLGWTRSLGEAIGSSYLALVLGSAVLAVFLWLSWWSFAPIDRRVRESSLLRRLDRGQPIWEIGGSASFATARLRDSVLMILLPVLVMIGASTLLAWAGRWMVASARAGAMWAAWIPRWARGEGGVGVEGVLQVLGFGAALALMPMLQRRIWSTTPLAAGVLRERIDRLCAAAGVRMRSVLVWRTGGLAVNAAVLGALPGFRYLIFTDALLEGMNGPEVSAVAAHEIGHVRHRHVAWLIAGLGATLILCGEAGAIAGRRAGLPESWVDLAAAAGAIVLGLPVVGFISRRFEWQADAYAVALLSRVDTQSPAGGVWEGASGAASDAGGAGLRGGTITGQAAGIVSRALLRAAVLNGADPRAPSWRHGSIESRRERIHRLVGRPCDRLPADAAARVLKIMILAACGVVGGLLLMGEG